MHDPADVAGSIDAAKVGNFFVGHYEVDQDPILVFYAKFIVKVIDLAADSPKFAIH